MHPVSHFSFFLMLVYYIECLTLQNDATIGPPVIETSPTLPEDDGCDPSTIPVMENFDIKRFSGSWYELAKSASGYIDMNDGIWIIKTINTTTTFLFSGRSINSHCIHPIKGKIHASNQPPGTLTLHYKTYSNHVEETIRVLFTDYTSVAVIYKCVHHVHRERQVCHPAGFVGAIWTREPYVTLQVYDSAVRYLEMACVHKSVLAVRNQVGTCEVDDFNIDDFPVPDVCYQPMDLGFCGGNLSRYHYNSATKTCEPFTYYGCGGNANNFMSLAECREKCLSVPPKEMVCQSVAECAIHCPPCCSQGRDKCVECNCEQVIEEEWTCVKSPGYCQSECTVEELYPSCYLCSCETKIEPVTVAIPVCLEVKAEGNCDKSIERYYYNSMSGECEQFLYSGCKGNKNNFETLEKCIDTCIVPGHIYKADVMTEDEGDSATGIKFNKWIIGVLLLSYIILHHKIL